MRLIAPTVVLATIVVIASGLVLVLAGPATGSTFFALHKISFFVWTALTAVHVLGHLRSLAGALRGDYATRAGLQGYETGRDGRVLSLADALLAGVLLAVLLIPEFGPWLHPHGGFLRHR